MKHFTLSIPKIERNFLKFALVILLIGSFYVSKAETLNDVLQNKDCTVDRAVALSIQLFTFAQKLYSCNFKDIESVVQFEYSNQIGILNALDKKTVLEIQSTLSTSQKLSLEYGFIGLPEYFLYKHYTTKDPSCGDSQVLKRIGVDYNECKLCMGNSFSTTNSDQINTLKQNNHFSYDQENNIFTFDESQPLNKILIESFQLLWNCNNPDDEMIVTGYYDESTEERLLKTDVNGFDKICMKCQVQNCGVCTSNYAQCLQCKDGFYMKDGMCVACSQSNCSKCTYDSALGSTTCNLCRSGLYLYQGQCVEQCPPEYKTTKTQCLYCRPGTYVQDEKCVECSEFCLECTGSNPAQCKSCFDGFVFAYGKGCSVCPTGQQCGKNRCANNQYRMLQYPYTCDDCFQNCDTCKGPLQNDCLTCKNNYANQNGFCLNPSFKAKKFKDPRTQTEKGILQLFLFSTFYQLFLQLNKECNFSCDECIDSSDLCTKCNPELNYFVKEQNFIFRFTFLENNTFYLNFQRGDRFRCYNRCPIYYQATTPKQDSSDNYIECVKSDSYTSDLQAADQLRDEAKSKCPKQQYWDIQTKQCNKCTNNCISCNDDSSCIECEPSYFWNDNHKTCSPCHPSCKKCTGPLYKDCLACPSANKLFPDVNGVCDATISTSLPQSNILTQNQIYENLNVCKSFLPQSQQQNYSVQFSTVFSSNDQKWQNVQMMSSDKPCTFQEFQNRYRYFKKNSQNCDDSQIAQSTIGKNGDFVTIYSMLLSQSNAQIAGQAVNPQSLVQFAQTKNFFSSSYSFNPTLAFNCNQLQCVSQLDSFLDGFTSPNGQKDISIKKFKDIVLTSTNQTPLSCFQDGQFVNQNSVNEIEQIVNNSQYTLNTATKQYFILYVCGKDSQDNTVQRALLVQKYLGNAFFEVLNVNSSQVEKISLYGASADQNAYLKKCDPSLTNSLASYLVQKVRVIQVVEQDQNIDAPEQMYQQYTEKANIQIIAPTKCSCDETKDYIFANENQGNQFITVITPQNKLLTQSINAFEIKHILNNHNIDPDVMKANSLSITKIEAESIYQDYIQETIQNTKQCFGITDSTPLCMVNVLADILFSNHQNCIFSKEITEIVKKANFSDLNNFIQKQNWCTLYNDRCLKAQQTLKSCV
ncbi:hypothetical protein ABPG74_000189 [Tetrahymena malaccensis]